MNNNRIIFVLFVLVVAMVLIIVLDSKTTHSSKELQKNSVESNRPKDFVRIDISSLPYFKDPWKDYLGFKVGDKIGFKIRPDFKGKIDIDFNYHAENCWGATDRRGHFGIFYDNSIPDSLLGRDIFIIGKVSKIYIKTPRDACDDTYGSFTLSETYFESYNASESYSGDNILKSNKYVIGPKYQTSSDIYGTYCSNDCEFFIYLNSMEEYYSLKNIPEYFNEISASNNWDGFAYIDKGGGVTGFGFWQIERFSPVLQENNYPQETAGELFNGVNLFLKWIRTSGGLEIYPDGLYQVRNSPNGIDWRDAASTSSYKVILSTPGGSVKFFKSPTSPHIMNNQDVYPNENPDTDSVEIDFN